MLFRFNRDKNLKLINERKISFQEIIESLENPDTIYLLEAHHNKEKYPKQKIFHILIKNQAYSVPFIIENDEAIFLKTAFPNRKIRKKLLEIKNKKPRL